MCKVVDSINVPKSQILFRTRIRIRYIGQDYVHKHNLVCVHNVLPLFTNQCKKKYIEQNIVKVNNLKKEVCVWCNVGDNQCNYNEYVFQTVDTAKRCKNMLMKQKVIVLKLCDRQKFISDSLGEEQALCHVFLVYKALKHLSEWRSLRCL